MEETIYSVSQAVKLLETQSHVLRYWEEELALPIKRTEEEGVFSEGDRRADSLFLSGSDFGQEEIRGKKEKAGDRRRGSEIGKDPFRIYGYYQQTGSTEAERAGLRGGPV